MYLINQFCANPPSAAVPPANGRLYRSITTYGCAHLRRDVLPASLPPAPSDPSPPPLGSPYPHHTVPSEGFVYFLFSPAVR